MAHPRSAASRRRGWHVAALATGLALAGVPTPAVPLATGDVAGPVADRDAAPAETLVVDAVLRVTRDATRDGGVIVTS